MDIKEIKQVPIVDFLYILGIEPARIKSSGHWYHAPYRNDRNPSLRVQTDRNVWYDYGIGRGGDIFNLAGGVHQQQRVRGASQVHIRDLGRQLPDFILK